MASSVKILHDRAMEIAQKAIIYKDNGNSHEAIVSYIKAFELEKEAAFLISKDKKSEPTRSILFRSAASLAYQAELYMEASQMVGEGLSGYPPKRIFNELNIINEKIKLAIYNIENDLTPNAEGFIFHLAGNAIEYGSIYYSDFLKRADSMQKLLRKTAMRLLDQPFNSRKDYLIPSFHAPKAGSFSIEVSVSIKRSDNYNLLITPSMIVDEYISCFNLLEQKNIDGIVERIKDDNHLLYFMSQAKEIAPDGDNITSVDFIGKRKSVSLSRTPSEIPLYAVTKDMPKDDKERKVITITGELDKASARKGNVIEITNDDGDHCTIAITDGIEEYVRSYFKRNVIVSGLGYDGHIDVLYSIKEIE